MCCGTNSFAPMLGIRYKSFDIYPPKYNSSMGKFEMTNWFDVNDLPTSILIILYRLCYRFKSTIWKRWSNSSNIFKSCN